MNQQIDKYEELRHELATLPFINDAQTERWVNLQRVIDGSRDYLIRAVPESRINIDTAQKILEQRTYTLVFFGGTGVGKSTLINALLGRNLLPTGAVTAVTGTIVYIEQADEDEAESLTLEYWNRGEFAQRVRRLCQLADIDGFDITNEGERNVARDAINAAITNGRELAKTERDEYLEILLDCIATYENHRELMKADTPPPMDFRLDDESALLHLREDGYKGSDQRQIRLVRSATFRIHPPADKPNLLMNGFLRIVDVPGLGAGMRLHEEITLEEMKKEDAMIVLVTDAGRQRVDEMKSLSAVNWIKENRLYGLRGSDLDDAAAKIFVAVNGANIRQAFDRLNSGLPEAEREIKEVTRHIAPNYWEAYADRGDNRPYFMIMAPSALYVQDPENAPHEFASETERIMKAFKDQLGPISNDPLDPQTAEKLLELSEVPLLRERLIDFIRNERVKTQLREASTRVRTALETLRLYYEKQLAGRGIYPPFEISWESLQERRYEAVLVRQQKELPRSYHAALVELSQRYNDDRRFRTLLNPSLNGIREMVEGTVEREIETLLDSYGTEHWDDRDVTYDNLIWGTSGIELPIKRILFQVELVMQEAVSQYMPALAEAIANEMERTLQAHEIKSRLQRAEYEQAYTYSLPNDQGEVYALDGAYDALTARVRNNFRQVCRQAVMYELVRPERSVHFKLAEGERELAMATNERLLDVALEGVDAVRQDMPMVSSNNVGGSAESDPAIEEDEFAIRILDEPTGAGSDSGFEISLLDGETDDMGGYDDLEASYADKLDDIQTKTNRIFSTIIDDLFSDDELLPRLRRLFWLEATRAERDFNNHIVKSMLRQHDRRLQREELRVAMEPDLESISDLEHLMRTWEGLHELEAQVY
ncbi:MAG: dynamin family protein [Anaerolineae bacterium]|nr:dynamin family protein [Anaerolineae bacterium]